MTGVRFAAACLALLLALVGGRILSRSRRLPFGTERTRRQRIGLGVTYAAMALAAVTFAATVVALTS